MTAQIKIIRKDPNPTTPVSYNQATGTWSGTFTTVFTGLARIQPVRNIRDKLSAQDATARQNIEVQIDSITTGINTGDILEVVTSASFPELAKFTFDVRSVVGNSTAWNTIITCEANLKKSA
jgi:hypothetical protein